MKRRTSTTKYETANNEVTESFVEDVQSLQEQLRKTPKELVSIDLTPDDYAQAYKYYERWKHNQLVYKEDIKVGKWLSRLSLSFPYRPKRNNYLDEYYKPISNAANKTLRLLIQELSVYRSHKKDVITREVEVPANYTFKQLHDVVDTVIGIKKQYKWKFGHMRWKLREWDCIALPIEVSPYGYLRWDYNAEKTEISGHLSLYGCWYNFEGHLLHRNCVPEIEENKHEEYVIISIVEIIERPCQHPCLINWKGEYYMQYLFEFDLFKTAKKFIEICKLPRKEAFKSNLAAKLGYDNWHDLDEMLDAEKFNPKEVQSFLNDMPSSEQMEAFLTNLRSAPKEWYEGKEEEPFVDDAMYKKAMLSKVLKIGLKVSEYSDYYNFKRNLDGGTPIDAQDVMVGKWLYTANLKYQSKMMNGHGKLYDPISITMGRALRLVVTWECNNPTLKGKVWRKVDVPAYYTFEQLHDVINILYEIDNEFPWKYGKWKNNCIVGDIISLPKSGHARWDVDASVAKISGFLIQNSYGYCTEINGLSHMFSISLKEVLVEPCRRPQMRDWSSPLNLSAIFNEDQYASLIEFANEYDLPDKVENMSGQEIECNNWYRMLSNINAKLFIPEQIQDSLRNLRGWGINRME